MIVRRGPVRTAEKSHIGTSENYSVADDTHLDGRIDSTDGYQRKMGMALDHIHNRAIALENVTKAATGLFPYEPVTVVRTRHNELVFWPKEVHYERVQYLSGAIRDSYIPSLTVSTLQ